MIKKQIRRKVYYFASQELYDKAVSSQSPTMTFEEFNLMRMADVVVDLDNHAIVKTRWHLIDVFDAFFEKKEQCATL